MKGIKENWVKLIIWVCACFSLVGFILVGGYSWINGNDEIKNEVKKASIIKLIFIGLYALLKIVENIFILAGCVSSALVVILASFSLVEIIAFIVLAFLGFFKSSAMKKTPCVVECKPKRVENLNDKNEQI